MSIMMSVLFAWAIALSEADPQRPESTLSVDRIFASDEFRGEGLGLFLWSRRAPAYFTLEAPKDGGPGRDLVRNQCDTGAREVVVPAAAFVPPGQTRPLSLDGLEFSADESKVLIFTNSQRVWRRNTRGDYWVLDVATRRLTKLGGEAAPSSLMFAKFSPDAARVAFVRENNLYVQDLNNLQVQALTSDGSSTIINGTSDWVNEEELDIRDAYRWSPDGRSIAFWRFDTSGVGQFFLIDNTSGKWSRPIGFAYPKVGEMNSATTVGVVSVAGGEVRWLDLPGDPREHYVAHVEWAPDGRDLLLQQFNRAQNVNRVLRADPKTGATTTVFTETDAAWLENENPVRWLDGGKAFLWLSERDGWRHAYRVSWSDGSLKRITQGDFDVIEVEAIDEKGGWLHFAASPGDATRRALFRTRLDGGPAERSSPDDQRGWHTYDVAPGGTWAVHTFSTSTTPPVIRLIQLATHDVQRVLVENARLRERLATLKSPKSEFLRLDIADGVTLDAWCLLPTEIDAERKHPLLFFVYGEPAGATVHDAWSGARGLWHVMLAQQGYVVASVDNRGTKAPRGRAWRKSVHRQIGILASQDQAAATRALLKRWPFVDPARVGIWGWSGGGSMSLNAIFRHPDLYRTAIAVAPNASQLLYDTIYQERYMGLPRDNPEGYRLGSPLTFAHQLRGDLLLVHGTGDDNCHYQGTELLINELIAQNKSFTVLPYPGRTHAIAEGRNTTRHLHKVMTEYLHAHLRDARSATVDKVNTWRKRRVQGWEVHVSEAFPERDQEAVERAIGLLARQLDEITRVVPEAAVDALRRVPLFISPEYPGVPPRAEYHPGAGWLRDNGRDPVMEKGVEFTNVRIFEAETRRMPNFALHELAHAFHDRVLGFDHPDVRAAHRRAKKDGRYDEVKRRDSEGNTRVDRAYALKSPQEFFAEASEAFFTRNDFQPFDHDELEAFDPETHALLRKLWGGGPRAK